MSGTSPYVALARLLKYKTQQQRALLRLEVWCERSRCGTPIRVFKTGDGLLMQCRSDADVRHMQEENPDLDDWSRRRALWLDEWLKPGAKVARLQVVCACAQTKPRTVDLQKLADLIPPEGEKTRRITLAQVLVASDG